LQLNKNWSQVITFAISIGEIKESVVANWLVSVEYAEENKWASDPEYFM